MQIIFYNCSIVLSVLKKNNNLYGHFFRKKKLRQVQFSFMRDFKIQ